MGALYHANWLLSRRFPRRLRPYLSHVPKVITRVLHHEASLMFEEALTISSQRKIREMMSGEGDIQMQWLVTSLRVHSILNAPADIQVERWREALLWTYVVCNMGMIESAGHWGDLARQDLKEMFGLGDGDEDVVRIDVRRAERWTLEPGRVEKIFEQAGWEAPKASRFLFCESFNANHGNLPLIMIASMDGHMPEIMKPDGDQSSNDRYLPLRRPMLIGTRCIIDLARCFGPFWSRNENMPASEMFTRLAFQYPDCGNCSKCRQLPRCHALIYGFE